MWSEWLEGIEEGIRRPDRLQMALKSKKGIYLLGHFKIQYTGLEGQHLRGLWGKQYSQERAKFQLGHGGEWDPHKQKDADKGDFADDG